MNRRIKLRIAYYSTCVGLGILVLDVAMLLHLEWSSFFILGLFTTWAFGTQVTRLR